MILRNKKTGEVGDLQPFGEDGKIWVWIGNMSRLEHRYNSLVELNEDWEDVSEEPKKYWFIDDLCRIQFSSDVLDEIDDTPNNFLIRKTLGNYFETREEAEKAVEKLKAVKRLKDKGFRFDGYDSGHNSNKELCGQAYFKAGNFWFDVKEDLDLLFGGEE